ncbi:MAG: hypothetical protein JO149_00605 [Gammaproteobacteria bacterium]|nr:hypothetical protein [Gammaproteobacteria bacterium]
MAHLSATRIALLSLAMTANAQAGMPVWTMTPLTSTQITISSGQTASVQYIVTNQSTKSHALMYKNMTGINQITNQLTPGNVCGTIFNLGHLQSCILSLQIDGSHLTGNVTSGPVVCDSGNPSQCYQPSQNNQLNITYSAESLTARLAYITQGYTQGVKVCAVDPTDGTLSNCIDAGGGSAIATINPQGIVIDHAGQNAFLTAGFINQPNVFQCAINPVTGVFSSCSVTTITSPSGYQPYYGLLTLNSASTIAFIVDYNNGATNRVLACPITNGTINPLCTDTGATGLTSDNAGIILNSTNTKAYIGGYGNSYITVCDVNGATFSSCLNKTGGGSISFSEPAGVALNAADNILYVADNVFHGVYACDTTPNGTGQFNNCFVATTLPTQPWNIVINKTNTFAYLTDYGSSVYICPILPNGTFATCTVNTSISQPVGIALKY